jgi:hypothetical protein
VASEKRRRAWPIFRRNPRAAAEKAEQPPACNHLKLRNKTAIAQAKTHEQKSGVVVTIATH